MLIPEQRSIAIPYPFQRMGVSAHQVSELLHTNVIKDSVDTRWGFLAAPGVYLRLVDADNLVPWIGGPVISVFSEQVDKISKELLSKFITARIFGIDDFRGSADWAEKVYKLLYFTGSISGTTVLSMIEFYVDTVYPVDYQIVEKN